MPVREFGFYNEGIYHIFNKTIDHRKVFENPLESHHFLNILNYYRSIHAEQRYSYSVGFL